MSGLAAMGVLGMALGVDDGGAGASSVDLGITVEESATADFVVGQLPVMGGLVANVVAQASALVRDSVLPALLAGRTLVAFALTEPEAGSDAGAIRCAANEDGSWLPHRRREDIDQQPGTLERVHRRWLASIRRRDRLLRPPDDPGATVTLFDDLGCRGLSRGSLVLDGVGVGEDAVRIGPEGGGFRLVMSMFDLTRTLIGLAAVATATASVRDAAAYAETVMRSASPSPPTRACRSPWRSISRRSKRRDGCATAPCGCAYDGMPHTTEAAMCKWWAVTVAVDAIHTVTLLHGHAGYATDLPHEQRLRDVIGMEWGDGTAQIQKLVIARALLGRDAVDARPARRHEAPR